MSDIWSMMKREVSDQLINQSIQNPISKFTSAPFLRFLLGIVLIEAFVLVIFFVFSRYSYYSKDSRSFDQNIFKRNVGEA